MQIMLLPTRRDTCLHLEKAGGALILNGETVDFADLQ